LFPTNEPERLVYRFDGMATYPQFEEQFRNGTYDLESVLDQRVPLYPEESFGLSGFTKLSETRKEKWGEFLSVCTDKDIDVIAFMPPVHPRLWDLLLELHADRLYDETDEFLTESTEQSGGLFKDYTLVDSFYGRQEYFRDEVHLMPENGTILLRNLLMNYLNEYPAGN
jgi:hypothetical protein